MKPLPCTVRRLAPAALGLLLTLACADSQGRAVLSPQSVAVTADRSTVDRPDDLAGPQVHFLYALPANGADRQLDTSGALEQSIARIQRWFVSQTGDQRLRVDTYQGAPDITFVRLPHDDAQMAGSSYPNHVLGEGLAAAGFDDPDKVYAAFYDGRSSWACGGAKSPALPRLAAMYLLGWPTNDPRPCSEAPGFGTGTDRPGYFEIGLLHEVLHTIGFAPSCAPHVSDDPWRDHVNDSPTDLMYGPDARSRAGWEWQRAVLDFNRDDYYRASVPGCPDLAESPFVGPVVEPSRVFTLSVTWRRGGAVRLTPGRTYARSFTARAPAGTRLTLSALPRRSFRFAGWSGACRGRATRCAVLLDRSKTVRATFVRTRR